MKKVLFAAAILAGTSIMMSCKKDYECECDFDGTKYTYDLKDVKKKDAQDACDAAGSAWILLGATCDLK